MFVPRRVSSYQISPILVPHKNAFATPVLLRRPSQCFFGHCEVLLWRPAFFIRSIVGHRMIAFFGKTDHRLLNIFERPPPKNATCFTSIQRHIDHPTKKEKWFVLQARDWPAVWSLRNPVSWSNSSGAWQNHGWGIFQTFFGAFWCPKNRQTSQATPGWPAMNVQRVHHFGSKDETKKVKYTLLWYVLAKQIVFLGIYNKINISIKMQKSDTHKNTERERESFCGKLKAVELFHIHRQSGTELPELSEPSFLLHNLSSSAKHLGKK